jgi:hypothetical protein
MKSRHPAVNWSFALYPQETLWLLLLLISIKRLRVENFMKDFQAGALHTPGSRLSMVMRGAA